MDTIKLSVKKRDAKKEKPRALRAAGNIPAVVYGKGKGAQSLAIDAVDFLKTYREAGHSAIIDLDIEGDKKKVLVQEVDYNPVTDEASHVDFYEISMTEKITTEVPLKFIGESSAVNDLSGTLLTNKNELTVECLPGDLPHEIEVDISVLSDFEISIHVSDVKLPAGVEVKDEMEETIASVEPPRSEEELAELEEPVEEGEMPESEHGEEEEEADSEAGEEAAEGAEEEKQEEKSE